MNKATYLLPIWVDIETDKDPEDVIDDVNEELVATFWQISELWFKEGTTVDMQWAVTKRVH